MKTNPNDSANSFSSQTQGDFIGLTKREYFTAMALQGLLANSHPNISSFETNVEFSVKYADALINQLNQNES